MSSSTITIDDVPLSRFHLRMFVYTGGGAFCDGYILGIIGIALAFLRPQLELSPLMTGLIGASALAGIFFGGTIFGYVTDFVGRRTMFIINLAVFVVASILQFFVTDGTQLLILRFILGLAVGADYPIATSLLAEFTPRKHRGLLLGALVGGWWVGYCVAYLVGYFLIGLGEDNWRWMLASSAVPAAILLLLRLGTPESPRWLINKGHLKEARKILDKFLGENVELDKRAPVKTSYRNIFRQGYMKRTIFVSLFWILQVAPGFAISTFTPKILDSFNLGEGNYQFIGSVVISLFYVVGVVPAIFLVGGMGRRKVLLWGFLFSAIVLFVLGIATNISIALIIALFAVYAIFHGGMSVLQWIYPNELFPTDIRATAVGFASGMSRIGATIGTFLMPLALSDVGIGTSVFIGGILYLVGFVISYFMAPETKDMTLEEASTIRTNVGV